MDLVEDVGEDDIEVEDNISDRLGGLLSEDGCRSLRLLLASVLAGRHAGHIRATAISLSTELDLGELLCGFPRLGGHDAGVAVDGDSLGNGEECASGKNGSEHYLF